MPLASRSSETEADEYCGRPRAKGVEDATIEGPIETAVFDLSRNCRRNGGTMGHEMRSPTRDDEKNDAYFYPSIEQQVARERYDDAQISRHLREQARPSGKPKVEDDSGHDAEEGTSVPKL